MLLCAQSSILKRNNSDFMHSFAVCRCTFNICLFAVPQFWASKRFIMHHAHTQKQNVHCTTDVQDRHLNEDKKNTHKQMNWHNLHFITIRSIILEISFQLNFVSFVFLSKKMCNKTSDFNPIESVNRCQMKCTKINFLIVVLQTAICSQSFVYCASVGCIDLKSIGCFVLLNYPIRSVHLLDSLFHHRFLFSLLKSYGYITRAPWTKGFPKLYIK